MMRIRPGPGDEAAVPAQQRLRLHEEARPADSWQCPADRREQDTVGGFQPRMWDLTAQHRELVAEHQDLQILSGIATGEGDEQLDGSAERQVGELRQHPGGLQDGQGRRHNTAPWVREPAAQRPYPSLCTLRPRQPHDRESQLPADRRGGQHPACVAQDRVPLGQGRQAPFPEDARRASPLPGGQDPRARQPAPRRGEDLSGLVPAAQTGRCQVGAAPRNLAGPPAPRWS